MHAQVLVTNESLPRETTSHRNYKSYERVRPRRASGSRRRVVSLTRACAAVAIDLVTHLRFKALRTCSVFAQGMARMSCENAGLAQRSRSARG